MKFTKSLGMHLKHGTLYTKGNIGSTIHLMSLKDVDYFPPGKEEWFGKWLLEENLQLKDVMDRGRICTMRELMNRRDKIVINSWRYSQLKHFIESLPQPIRATKKSTSVRENMHEH